MSDNKTAEEWGNEVEKWRIELMYANDNTHERGRMVDKLKHAIRMQVLAENSLIKTHDNE